MKPSIRQKLELLVDRLDEIDRLLAAPDTANDMEQFRKISRERAEVEPSASNPLSSARVSGSGSSAIHAWTRPARFTPTPRPRT